MLAAVAVAATAIAVSLVSVSSAGPVQHVLVVEHATTDTLIDIEPSGDSTGDLLTFHDDVFDTHGSTLAVTGATGNFRGATGTMRLEAGPGAGEYQFTFRLTY